MEEIPVRYRPIIVVALLIVGGVSLRLLEDMPQELQAKVEVTPRPVLHLVADVQRQFERMAFVATRVSVEEENRLGEKIASRYKWRNPEGAPAFRLREEYIRSVAMKMVPYADRSGINYTFHYIPNPGFVNAFALPGGQIFMGEGLLQMFETEDELAAVLGHEISHVDRRHCIELFQYELAAQKYGVELLYGVARLPLRIFKQSYTKEQELEADEAGLILAVEAGYSPAGGLSLFEKFSRFDRGTQRSGSIVEEVLSLPRQSLQEYFRSHPPASERRAKLEQVIASYGWPVDQPQRPLKFPKPGAESDESPTAP